DDDLDLAPLLVEADVAMCQHLGAVVQRRTPVLPLKHDATQREIAFLQREVDVPASGPVEVGDLALHPEVGELEIALKELFDVTGEPGDAVGFNHGSILSRLAGKLQGGMAQRATP